MGNNNFSINQLSENGQLMEYILDSISSAVLLIDQNKDVLKYNKPFIDMFRIDFKLNSRKLFRSINIISRLSGVEYFKIRFNKEDEDDYSRNCLLNIAVNKAIRGNISTKNKIIADEYYDNGELKHLYLSFSVKPLEIAFREYVLITFDDISESEKAKHDLIENNLQIQRYNNIYRSELKTAKKVQSSILPKKAFRNDGFKIDFRYFPLGEIGGDFFDFFKIDEKNIGLLLCDVAGHGVPSALITMMIKTMLESIKQHYLAPKNVVKYINNQLIKILENCYLTMIYGVINIETATFTYVRAGHPKPWLLRDNTVLTLGLNNNIMLGVDEKVKFEEDTVTIEKKNKLILFTDGLIDIGKKNSGYEKEILTLLKDNSSLHTDLILDKIEKNIKERLQDEKHQDDICVIVVERIDKN